jgi:hypothetical protein
MKATEDAIVRLKALGYEAAGSFYCAGELIIGDPGHIAPGAAHPDAEGNLPLQVLEVHKGNWFVFARRVELEPPLFDQVVVDVLACYQGELDSLPDAMETLEYVGTVQAESGQICIIDSVRADEEGLSDDLMFDDSDIAIVRDAGVSVTTEPDGSFPILADGSEPRTLVSVLFWTEAEEEAP